MLALVFMDGLLSIGQFVKLTGLSARMVRFYQTLGLLRPRKISAHNSYRYYSYEQTLEAEKIRLLRSLEMPLEEIHKALSNPENLTVYLAKHRQLIEDKIARYHQALAGLELLEQNQGQLYAVQLQQFPKQGYVAITHYLPLSKVDSVRASALKELKTYLGQLGQAPLGPGFAILDESGGEKGIFRYTFAVPSNRVPASDSIAFDYLDARQAALVRHMGPYEPLHLAFLALNLWCHQQERTAQQKIEVYRVGPLETTEPSRYQTEIQFVLD